MRLQTNMQPGDKDETAKFAQWILDVGDGISGHPNDGYSTVKFP